MNSLVSCKKMEIIRELSLVVDTDAQCNTLQKALLLDLKYGVQKMFTGNTVDRLVYKAQVIKTADYALQHFTDHCIYPKLVNLFNLVENF